MKKKLLLYVVFMMTTLCSYADGFKAYDFTVDGIFYKIKSKTDFTCSVSHYDSKTPVYSGDIVIPEKVVYQDVEYTVTEISMSAFRGCSALTSISLPESIESIGTGAFSGCVLLKEINLPRNIKYVSLTDCPSLTDVKIPGSVTQCSFDGCSSLKTITFEDGEEDLTLYRAFDNTPQLDSIYIGRNFEKYTSNQTSYGIYNHPTLRSVYISNTVTRINDCQFYVCRALDHVYGMKQVESIGWRAFSYCESLKSFIIEDNVTSLGTEIFYDCNSLDTLVVGNGVTTIGEKTFGKSIKTMYLGNNIKTINVKGGLGSEVYLFSNVLGEMINTVTYKPKVIYVPDPQRYKAILAGYNLQPMLTFNETSLEYTGCTPELSYKNNVDGFNVSFDEDTTPKDAGSYSMNVDVTFSNADWSATVEIPCSYTITKAPLTVIANNARRYYGEENPELTETIIGFKNGETEDVLVAKPVLSTLATSESDAGTYPIYCSGADAKNYAITFQHGTLTIDKAPQKIVWEQDFADAEVGDMIELTATCSSGMPVKYRSSDQTSVLIASQGDMQYVYILKPATVAITAYQPGNKNYEEADEISKIVIIQATGIHEVHSDLDDNVSYYSLDGKQLARPVSGCLILKKKSDGTVHKMYCK